MIGRLLLGALLTGIPGAARAQPGGAPDRAPELLQLQFNSRSVRPSPGRMDGARATAIYKRFTAPATPSGQAGGQGSPGAGAPSAGSSPQ